MKQKRNDKQEQQGTVQHYNAEQLLPDIPAEYDMPGATEFWAPETFLDLYSRPEETMDADDEYPYQR